MLGDGLEFCFRTADDGCSDAIVEECDYLADNIHVPILSPVTDGFKQKVDGPSAQFRNGNVAPSRRSTGVAAIVRQEQSKAFVMVRPYGWYIQRSLSWPKVPAAS
jgi:hypothetical protein